MKGTINGIFNYQHFSAVFYLTQEKISLDGFGGAGRQWKMSQIFDDKH